MIPDIISLHKAFELGFVIVKELPSERVNSIELENTSSKYVFILDGDILKGAKQDRVVNTSVLVALNQKLFFQLVVLKKVDGDLIQINLDLRVDSTHKSSNIRYSKLKTISESVK